MSRQPRHSDFQELLGAYAVDCLDAAEQAMVEGHVESCRSCRHEVDTLREVVGHLSGDLPPAAPEIWGRIASSIEPPPAPARGERASRSRFRPQTISFRLAGALAAAAVLVIGFMGVRLVQQ